jgi:hypothetical protein
MASISAGDFTAKDAEGERNNDHGKRIYRRGRRVTPRKNGHSLSNLKS